MEYTFGEFTMQIEETESDTHRVVVAQAGTAITYEEMPTRYQAVMGGLYVIARLTGNPVSELYADMESAR